MTSYLKLERMLKIKQTKSMYLYIYLLTLTSSLMRNNHLLKYK